QTYWNAPYVNSRNLTATAKGHCMPTACCGGVDSTMPPLPPTPEKRIVDLSAMQATTKLAAEAIGFLPSDPLYGAYAWGTPFGDVTTCNVTEADFPDGWAMVIFAATDLDGDGIMGGMSMQIGIRGEDLYRAPGYGTVGDGLRQLYDMDCPGCGDFAE
ncbi:MAG: hypothetical protein KC416_16575, partial [Myxococcales bacterium]|nr:hypothetical protein [Myxococcales bacterium]